jgi:hypothetical protein
LLLDAPSAPLEAVRGRQRSEVGRGRQRQAEER